RRHTRFSRDWSSDVCSSDLERLRGIVESLQTRVPPLARLIVERYAAESPLYTGDPAMLDHLHLVAAGTIRAMLRSALRAVLEPEERKSGVGGESAAVVW